MATQTRFSLCLTRPTKKSKTPLSPQPHLSLLPPHRNHPKKTKETNILHLTKKSYSTTSYLSTYLPLHSLVPPGDHTTSRNIQYPLPDIIHVHLALPVTSREWTALGIIPECNVPYPRFEERGVFVDDGSLCSRLSVYPFWWWWREMIGGGRCSVDVFFCLGF